MVARGENGERAKIRGRRGPRALAGGAWILLLSLLGQQGITADVDRTFLYEGDLKYFVKPEPPGPPLHVVGGTLIDGHGGPPRQNPGILVRDGRFEAIGSSSLPADAVRIDARDKWILPGLFDLHAHITFHLPSGFHVEDDVLNALRSERFLENYQRIGVTTVRDVASRNNVGYSLKRAQRMGMVQGARLYVSGPGLTVTGGHAAEFQPYEPAVYAVEADGPWQMRQRVRDAVKLGADLIKILPPLSLEEMRAVVEEAHFWKLRVTAHVGGPQDLAFESGRNAVQAGVDSVEHLYPYGSGADSFKTLTAMAKRGIYAIPTVAYHLNELNGMSDHGREWMQAHLQFDRSSMMQVLRDMQKAGVKICVGTDSNAIHMLSIGELYLAELEGLRQGGLSPAAVIQAATLNSAEAMGLGEEAGSITAGKRADLILLDGDPLASLRAIVAPSLVVQQGRIVHRR